MGSSLNDLFTDEDAHEITPAPGLTHFQNLDCFPPWREIHLCSEIEEETGAWFVRCVRWLESKSALPIRLVLRTPGGDMDSMFEIHDAMRSTRCPIEVYAYGQVCSAGVLILAAGDRRLVSENTVLMWHESSGYGSEGDLGFRAAKDRHDFYKWQHGRWCELVARYTPRSAAWWNEQTHKQAELWMHGGAEIVERGLADEVVESWPIGVPVELAKRILNHG